MKTIFNTVVGVAALATILAPGARAGCADIPARPAAFVANGRARLVFASDNDPDGSSIVGLWKVKFVAQNNPGGVPDGTIVDAGYAQWHSDGTEIMNSSRPPATQNFCLGAWKKIGHSTFRLNHFGLSFDLSGNLNGTANIREQVVVDHDRNHYTGAFTIDVLDLNGNQVAHLAGEVAGERITAD